PIFYGTFRNPCCSLVAVFFPRGLPMAIRQRTWAWKGRERTAWIVDYSDAKGKRRLKIFRTKRAALDCRHAHRPEARDARCRRRLHHHRGCRPTLARKLRSERPGAIDARAVPSARRVAHQASYWCHQAQQAHPTCRAHLPGPITRERPFVGADAK